MNLYRSSASVFENDTAPCFYRMAGCNGSCKCIFYYWPDPRMDESNQFSVFQKTGGREKEYHIGSDEECECTQNPVLL